MLENTLGLLDQLLKKIPAPVRATAIDAALDAIENGVEATENKLDDALVLPLCKMVRIAANVPDND